MKAVNISEDEKAVDAVMYIADYCDKRRCSDCYLSYRREYMAIKKIGYECIFYKSLPNDWKEKLNAIMKERSNRWTNPNTVKN